MSASTKRATVYLDPVLHKALRLKCPACGELNEEDPKFCQECGGTL